MGKAEALRYAVTRLRVPQPLVRGADAFVAALLAPRCAACEGVLDVPLAGPVCPRCWEDARRSSGTYDGALRQIIHAFKYEGRRSLAIGLSELLREKGHPVLNGADCVVPVPLFPSRRMRRGFNQAAEVSRHLGVPVVHALWRVRHTASQTGLTATERRRNVRGAFMLSPLIGRFGKPHIAGATIVLVDDVLTTGATLGACAEVLTAAGAREVRLLTLARAHLHGSG